MTTRRAFLRSLLQISDAHTETADLTDDYWLFGHKDGEEYGRRFRPSKLKTIVGGGGSTLPPMRNPVMLSQASTGTYNIQNIVTTKRTYTFNIQRPGSYTWAMRIDAEMGIRNPPTGGVYNVFSRALINGASQGHHRILALHYAKPAVSGESIGVGGNITDIGYAVLPLGNTKFEVQAWYDSTAGHTVDYSRIKDIYVEFVEVPRTVLE